MNLTIYKITNEIKKAEEYLEYLETIEKENINEEEKNKIEVEKINIEKALDILINKMLKNKADNIIKYIKVLDNKIDGTNTELKRLKEVKDRTERKKEKLQTLIIEAMQKLKLKEISTNVGDLKINKNPLSVVVLDESKVPIEYIQKEVKEVIKVDKMALKNNFKETGELIDGVQFIDDKYNLKIK